MRCDAMSRRRERAWFGQDNATFGRRTVPGMCEPDLSIDSENDFKSIFGPGAVLKRSRDASGGGGGLPEAGKRAPSSGLQRISWILSAGCSGLKCQGPTEWAGLAGLAGLGWLAGWAGWLGLQDVPNSVPESSVPFGRGPPAVGRSQQVFSVDRDISRTPAAAPRRSCSRQLPRPLLLQPPPPLKTEEGVFCRG